MQRVLPSLPGYRLDAILHRGPRTVVYRGVRLQDDAPIVLKVPSEDRPAVRLLARFHNEAALLARVRGTGVVRLLERTSLGPHVALVLADVGGASLRDRLRSGPLAIEPFLDLATRLTEAIGVIHEHGVVHRDINPANVVVDPGGAVEVIDFGLATALQEDSGEQGGPEGTLAYLSPEQSGRMNRPVDARTDFYALGATFYELLTGSPPFVSDDPLELIHAHLALRPPPPRGVDEGLAAVLLKLLAKAPEDRYQSAAGLLADLSRCRQAWTDTLRIDPFPLGQADHATRLDVGTRLHAREAELATLSQAFARASAGAVAVALLEGSAGVGKTSLVRELFRPIAAARGFFAAGKCDELHRNEPHYPWNQALHELVRQLLTASEAAHARWKEAILAEVGANAVLLIETVPQLERLLGPQPAVPELPPTEARNRHHRVFIQLLRALSASGRPLAIYLDDVQWADLGTLHLVESLSRDLPPPHLLLVLGFRPEEVTPQHPLHATLDRLRDTADRVALSDLPQGPVTDMVADALSCKAEEAAPLAAVVQDKTRGNPFFVRQFLAVLERDGLLRFARGEGRWTWDLERIRQSDITDNVAHLLASRIEALSAPTREALMAAACVGTRFDLDEVAAAMGVPATTAAEALRPALAEGLVIAIGEGYRLFAAAPEQAAQAVFRFLHDRVRHAADGLLTAARRAACHLAIGRHLRDQGRKGDLEVARHLNHAHDLLETVAERDALAELNVRAGRQALRSAEPGSALTFLTSALALLGTEGWTHQPVLTLDAHLEAAMAASTQGDSEQVHALVDAALARVTDPVDRARALDVRVGEHLMRGDFGRALTVSLEALALLGEHFPDNPSRALTAAELGRTLLALSGHPPASLASLPPGHDRRHRVTMRLLSRGGTAAFLARPAVAPHLGLRTIQRSLRHGLTPESSRGFATLGAMHAMVLGNVTLGDRFGRIALEMAERFPAGLESIKTRWIALHMVRHWCAPMQPIVAETLETYRTAVQFGDFEDGQFMAWAYCRMSYQAGTPLATVDVELARMTAAVEGLRRGPAPPQWGIQRQVVDSLMGRSDTPAVLPGVKEQVERAVSRGDKLVAWTGAYEQAWLSYVMDDVEAAFAWLPVLEDLVEGMAGLPEVPHYHTLAALVRIAMLDRQSRREQHPTRRAILGSLRRLARWGRHGAANYAHRHHLVEAEWARVLGDAPRAAGGYDAAVAAARTHGFPQEEALALTLAGRFHLAGERDRLARFYLADAVYAWEKYGAAAVARHLRERHSDLLSVPSAAASMTTGDGTLTTGEPHLDLMTVLKASQTISGEIVLERLLERLLLLALESAGAGRACLVLDHDGTLVVEADGDVERTPVVAVRARPLQEAEPVATSVIRYVSRTRTVVALDDAADDATFGPDPYVRSARPRSVLCVPVLYQGRNAGVLYLENNLAARAFTPDRQQVLQVLTSQAAISLENARLYARLNEHGQVLEQRVAERTEALLIQNRRLEETLLSLRQAQEQIVTQQKLAYLGTLTAGIAHEIRNPLNFVTNFASMSRDLLGDLRDALPDRSEEVEAVVADLARNTDKIREHAARADRVVQSMLLHAGTSSGEHEPSDLNALVAQSAELARHGHKHPRNVELSIVPDPSLPLVRVAPRDIARAFLNVIGNAVYAAAERAGAEGDGFRPQVTVTTARVDGTAVVRVRDNGNGIAPEVRERLFAPFFTTRPAGQGTGLGLSITWDIVVGQHGGRLTVASEPGQFAEFVIELPIGG